MIDKLSLVQPLQKPWHFMASNTPLPYRAGVYMITNSVNGKVYIGSSKDIYARWNFHRFRLRNSTHGNSHLQSAWNKYGDAAFTAQVLLICSPKHLLYFEQLCLDKYMAYDRTRGYNAWIAASSALGTKMSMLARQRMSAIRKGKPGHPVSPTRR